MLKKNKRNVSMNVSMNGQNSVAGDHDGIDNSQYVLEADPDLHKEVEIVLPKSNRQSARSRASMSGKSRKTVQSQSEKHSESRENIVRSRGRPIKPHETEPFLSIDNLPPEKSFMSDKSAYNTPANTSRVPKPAPQTSGSSRSLEAQLQRMTAYMSPYNQRTPAPPSSLKHRLLESVLKEEQSDNDSDISDNGPSIVNGHIHSKSARSTEARTSFLDQPGVGPATPTDQNGAKITSDNITQPDENEESKKELSSDAKNGCLATSSNSLKNRPKSAPASGVSFQNGSKIPADKSVGQNDQSKPSSGSAISRDKNSRSPSRPSSVRSKVSSKGSSRPGTASRPGSQLAMNMIGYRSIGSRTGRITPANTPFQSPNKQVRQPNHHIKTPFKHSVSKPEMSPDGRMTPSMGMKERTALAAFHVHKLLAVAGEKDGNKTSGKLKKGKLKPLYPVNVQGPKIEQCRGIISEARSYQPSPSRTLQRRLNLIDQIPNVHEYLYERPRTVESVHQTSIASSIDDYDVDAPDTNRSLPDEILYAQEPSNLAPENTFMPEATQEEMIARFQAMNSVDDTPRMFATEVGHNDTDDVTTKTDLTVSDHVQHELHVSESTEEMKETADKLEPSSENTNNCNNNNIDNGGFEKERDEQARGGSSDGRSRLGSPSKSVRFAQGEGSDNSKEMKQIRNESIVKQQRGLGSAGSKVESEVIDNNEDIDKKLIETVSNKNKENTKVSCKPDDDKIIKKDDNDDDDNDRAKDGGGGNGGGVNINNSEPSGSQVTSGSSEGQSGKDSGKSGTEPKDNENHDGLDREKSRSNELQNGKRNIRSRSASRDRTGKSNDSRSQIRKSQKSAKSSKTKKLDSAGRSRCSKFEQSQASKQHINKLEASSVLHSDRVSVSLRPESPKRNLSRSASPSRLYDQPYQFIAPMSRPCFETPDDFDYYHGNSQRSKVKFLLEGEEPEVETIFIENNDDVDIDLDKVITYDVLDTEIAMLRSAIQNSLIVNNEHTEEIVESENDDLDLDEQEDTETEPDSESETIENETERENTVRGDYSNILEKYRQKCMERSETYGAISTTLVTPRDTKLTKSGQGQAKVRKNCSKSSVVSNGNDESDTLSRPGSGKKLRSAPTLSDSGHGSADNMSEFSNSTSKVSVPKLELGGSTSDLGMESGRSDVTVTNDNDLDLGDKNVEVVEDKNEGKNLLEIVCDQLTTPVLHDKKPLKRKDLIRHIMLHERRKREEREVDVTNLQVVATMKSLSKNKKQGSSTSQKAPFPPLCFTINARPPPGYLYYFAYGPDMNPNRFSSYIQRDVTERYWGLLFGFNLVFNKRGTSEEAGGFANIEFNPLRSVEGCIFKITQQELNVLDKCVGYPEHYQHLMLPVWLSNSSNPDSLGVAQYCVPALTFIAQNKWTETEKTLNCDYALSQCIKSADLVSTEYRDSLKSMATQQPITASG
ncbi:hypothetical protein ACF0H5_021210 [Mactra antiquata]